MSVTHLPISERIMETLVKRLQRGRYVQEVVRMLKAPDEYTPKDRQVIVFGSEPAREDSVDCPGPSPAIAYWWTINIYGNVLQSEKDTLPVETSLEVMRADIIKAVCNATPWWTFDSLALNAEWLSHSYTLGTGFQTVLQPLRVLYRVKEADPYTVQL